MKKNLVKPSNVIPYATYIEEKRGKEENKPRKGKLVAVERASEIVQNDGRNQTSKVKSLWMKKRESGPKNAKEAPRHRAPDENLTKRLQKGERGEIRKKNETGQTAKRGEKM